MRLTKLAELTLEYRMALVNATIFAIFSFVVLLFAPKNLALVLLPNVLFLLCSLTIWIQMMKNGWALTPVCWFILGSGIFFGFGVIAGGMQAHPWSEKIYGDSTQHLLRANTLNSVSVLTVLVIAALFAPPAQKQLLLETSPEHPWKRKRLFRYLSIFALAVVSLRLIFFPDVDNLIFRSILGKAYFLLPSAFLLLGIFFRELGKTELILLGIAFSLQTLQGILLFNKLEILMPSVALVIGVWVSARSYKLPIAALMLPVIIFWIANPLVSMGRLHYRYDASLNTLHERVEILTDTVTASLIKKRTFLNPQGQVRDTLNITERMNISERIRGVAIRFDVASVQGFLINEYDAGRPGNTLTDFLAVLVPRIFWPEKPIITRFGNELSVKYHNNDPAHGSSAMAPTYTGEAYWNMGWFGVLAVSAYLGICFGLLSRPALAASQGKNLAYLFIAYPLLISAAFVESWVTSTYIGGMATIIAYYFMIKVTISMIGRGDQSA
jgi:hypothetical protein